MSDVIATTQPGVAAPQAQPAAQPSPAPQLSQEERMANAFLANEAATTGKPAPTGAAPSEAPAEQPAAAPADGTPEIRTLADLTKFLEAQEDDIMGLEVPLNVDGQQMSKPLRDVIKGYQLDAHNTQKSQQLSELRAKAEADFKAQQEAGNAYFQKLNALGQYAQEQINHDFKSVDWAALERQDPARYVMLRQQFTDRQAAINTYLGQVDQHGQQLQAQAQQRQQAQVAETVKAVQEVRPEWRDMSTFNKDCDAIKAAVLKVGLPAQDLPMILSHPAYLLIADAATKYLALQAAQPAVEKKVAEAPKFVRPGARQTTNPKSKAQEAISRLRADPKNQDKQAAAFDALLGS